jgi:hypothetical protein
MDDLDIPTMPAPATGGFSIRPLRFAKPIQRAPDGSLPETREVLLSREKFQHGVGLLGEGKWGAAEESFRDAIGLCAEEPVYLIGLGRAIFFNPGYKAELKVPVLRDLVNRATRLAPDDENVATLDAWVTHAEKKLGA